MGRLLHFAWPELLQVTLQLLQCFDLHFVAALHQFVVGCLLHSAWFGLLQVILKLFKNFIMHFVAALR